MVEAWCLTEQLGHIHVLDATYVHVRNSYINYILNLDFVGAVRPVKQLIKLKWPYSRSGINFGGILEKKIALHANIYFKSIAIKCIKIYSWP